MLSPLILWCNRWIKSGFYLIFALIPLLLTPVNYELFEYNKMMAVYILTSSIVAAWLIKALAQKEFRLARTPLDIPIALFVISQLVSSLFSIDPHVSWLGYYSRFNGGMWSVISYVALYYAFLSNSDVFGAISHKNAVHTEKLSKSSKNTSAGLAVTSVPVDTADAIRSISRLLKTSLITATIVAIYGVLEHMGIDKRIWVQDVQNRVFSTLGQPNWLAAYIIALVPLTWTFALKGLPTKSNDHEHTQRLGQSVFYMLLSALFFLVLLYTRSRSGLLAFAVADVLYWAGTYISKKSTKTTHFALVAIHILFALIVFFNGTYIAQIDKYITLDGWKQFANKVTTQQSNKVTPEQSDRTTGYTAPALESGGTESTVIRKYVWEGAINAWKSSTKTKLIGTGTETFAFAFYQFRPVEHNMTSEWDFLYNKAHNEYLNFLATTGAFGFGSYLLLIAVFIFWFIRRNVLPHLSAHASTIEDNPLPISLALFAGWISLLVTNFFGFSVVVTQLFLFLFPATIYLLTSGNAIQYIRIELPDAPAFLTFLPVTVQTRFLRIMQIIVLCIGIAIIFHISTMWYADKQFAQGYQYDRAGMYAQSIPALLSAISLNPQEPLYHDELAGAYSTLAAAAYGAHEATQTATLVDLALSESNIATTISPKNVNFLKTRTKVYYSLSTITPSLNNSAISTLEQALTLSPNDPKIYYNLAILSGRNGDNNKAIAYLLKAKALKRDYRDVYNALNIFYLDAGKKKEAQVILEEYLTKINPNDKDFRSRITP